SLADRDLPDLQRWFYGRVFDGIFRRHAEDFNHLGQEANLVFWDLVVRMCVEDDFFCRPLVAIDPRHPLPHAHFMGGDIDLHVQIIARQPGWDFAARWGSTKQQAKEPDQGPFYLATMRHGLAPCRRCEFPRRGSRSKTRDHCPSTGADFIPLEVSSC